MNNYVKKSLFYSMQLLCVVDSDALIWTDKKKKGFTTAAPTEAWESKAKPTCPSLS